jgi:DNA-binding Lrp family transcriptional regulator
MMSSGTELVRRSSIAALRALSSSGLPPITAPSQRAADFPEVMEMHKLSGQYCSLLKVVVPGVAQLEACLERLGEHGELISNIVLFSPLTGRILEQEPEQGEGDPLPGQIWAT